jgi:hypothetical protein
MNIYGGVEVQPHNTGIHDITEICAHKNHEKLFSTFSYHNVTCTTLSKQRRNTHTQQEKQYWKKCFLCGPRHAQC